MNYNKQIKKTLFKIGLSLNLIMMFTLSHAQSLQRPIIWTTAAERPSVLEKIEKYDWARNLLDQLHQQVDPKLKVYLQNPNTILDEIPAFAESDHQNKERESGPIASGHNKILSLASHAGILYHLSGEEKYAQFAPTF